MQSAKGPEREVGADFPSYSWTLPPLEGKGVVVDSLV